MKYNRTPTVEIIGDGKTVWVNDAEGCIGRFGRGGVDVHRSVSEQMDGSPECLDCFHEGSATEQWKRFCDSMMKFHQVFIPEEFCPAFANSP